jgi:hypothetical protein
MDDKAIKGLIFFLLLVPLAVRYFIKTGNNDMRLNWIDYTIVVVIIVAVVVIN